MIKFCYNIGMDNLNEIKRRLDRIQQRTSLPAVRINPDGSMTEYEIRIIKVCSKLNTKSENIS